MADEPTAPGAEDELDDDEPEVEGFMEMPKLGNIGSIMPPIVKSPTPTGPANPSSPGGGTIQPPAGSGGTPGPVTFPGPA
jgi:hypothetical protein